MHDIAAMRGASDGELIVSKPEGVCGAALDERDRLDRLDGRARINRTLDIAEREQEMSVRVGDSDCPSVAALDDRPARHTRPARARTDLSTARRKKRSCRPHRVPTR